MSDSEILPESTLYEEGRQVAPSGHAPRLEAYVDAGVVGLRLQEVDCEGAWMHMENPVRVEQ